VLQDNEKRFICTRCGIPSRHWQQRCPYCRQDGTLQRDVLRNDTVRRRIARFDQLAEQHLVRIDTSIPSLNDALGGGLVPGSIIVIYGQPGAGKSTLLLQAACSASMVRTLCVSGEEARAQVTLNLQRLGLIGVTTASFLHTNSTSDVISAIGEFEPTVAFVDSAQSFISDRVRGTPGSVTQVKRLVEDLTKLAKAGRVAIMLVGQVNGSGKLAGPKKMPHWVDAVIEVKEVVVGGSDYLQLLTTKNRFGPTGKEFRSFMVKTADGIFSVPRDSVVKPRIPISHAGSKPAPKPMSAMDLVDLVEGAGRTPDPTEIDRRVLDSVTRTAAPPVTRATAGRVTASGLTVIDGGRGAADGLRLTESAPAPVSDPEPAPEPRRTATVPVPARPTAVPGEANTSTINLPLSAETYRDQLDPAALFELLNGPPELFDLMTAAPDDDGEGGTTGEHETGEDEEPGEGEDGPDGDPEAG